MSSQDDSLLPSAAHCGSPSASSPRFSASENTAGGECAFMCESGSDAQPTGGAEACVHTQEPSRGRVDLTQGGLRRGILQLSWPILSGAVLNWIMGVADIKMVGALGPEAIAAVGQSMSIIFIVQFVVLAVATGTQVLAAQYTGARQKERVAEVTRQAILISFIIGVPLIPIGLATARPLLICLGATGETLRLGVIFTHVMFWASVAMMLNFLLTSSLQGAGDTLTPLYILLGINVSHIACAYLLIFGVGPFPQLGVAGAAWAVVITRSLGALWMLKIITSGRYAVHVPWRGPWRLNWPIWGKMFYIGAPSSIQGFVRSLGYAALIAILNRTAAKEFAVAGHIAAGQWNALGVFVGLAMMTAAMTAVGQNMGARNIRRAERSCWAIASFSALSSVILGLLCVALAQPLIRFFTKDPQAFYWGYWALIYIAASLPFATLSMAFSGALRGAGDTLSPLWATIIGTLFVGPGLSWLWALHAGQGPIGVWRGMIAAMLAQALYTGLVFKAGHWKKINIIGKNEPSCSQTYE